MAPRRTASRAIALPGEHDHLTLAVLQQLGQQPQALLGAGGARRQTHVEHHHGGCLARGEQGAGGGGISSLQHVMARSLQRHAHLIAQWHVVLDQQHRAWGRLVGRPAIDVVQRLAHRAPPIAFGRRA